MKIEEPTSEQKANAQSKRLLAEAKQGASTTDIVSRLMAQGMPLEKAKQMASRITGQSLSTGGGSGMNAHSVIGLIAMIVGVLLAILLLQEGFIALLPFAIAVWGLMRMLDSR